VASGRDLTTGLSELRIFTLIRLVGLGFLLWGIWSEVRPGTSGAHLAAWVLVVSLVPPWIFWTADQASRRRLRIVSFAWMAAAGGALAVSAHLALVFVGLAALGAGGSYELPVVIGVDLVGVAALLVTSAATTLSGSLVTSVIASGLAGTVMGVARRQSRERAAQAVLVAVEHDRAELERARAEVLSERNRLGREMHDILAHTLGALAISLEALDAQLDGSEAPAFVREGVQRTRAMATDGLAEARRAVRALRDDAEPLETQVRKLCDLRGAHLAVRGTPRSLPPESTLALYRVAQESLTNAAKHAPGAIPTVSIDFDDDAAVALTVTNGAPARPPGPLAETGSGYGLDGIRERLRLLGGEVAAGPREDGWLVEARLPL